MRGAKKFASLQRRQEIAPRERWTIVRLSHQARGEKQSVTARQKKLKSKSNRRSPYLRRFETVVSIS
jgi:hypothetical protein